MLDKINAFLMILTIMSGVYMLTRYVFLEQGMEAKKQRLFYICSFCMMLLSYFVFDAEIAMIVAILFGGLNIALGRKKHRLVGILLIIPLVGIMDGIAAFILTVRVLGLLLPFDAATVQIGELGCYFLIGILFLIFYLKGREWREWFRENMQNRRPFRSEYVVLCVSGVLMLIASNMAQMVSANTDAYPEEAVNSVLILFCVYAVISFLLAVTVVVLIMQGNRRKFYHDRVSNMQFSVIATMADIVENRDSNTGGHIKRTAEYVRIIGRNLMKAGAFSGTLTEQYLADMIVAAPLHDIGKISIPDAILNKPGRLTDEEFEIMKTHAVAGRDVLLKAEDQLGGFNYLDVAVEMAEYHHEWWNGKGYPNGISGEEIPLCARIMAVADVFDALTSKRCYKEAMPLEKAYGIIREETGTHFDPVVAEAFLRSKEEIEAAIAGLSE